MATKTWLSAAVMSVGVLWHADARAEDISPPQIVHEPCEGYTEGKPFTIVVRFFDESELFAPRVVFKSRFARWRNVPFKKIEGGEFTATIPARLLRGSLTYFIEAFDALGNGPARFGGPRAPVRVEAMAEPPTCVQVAELSPSPAMTSASPKAAPQAPPQALEPTPPPAIAQPVATGCDAPDAGIGCSMWFWVGVSAVVVGGGVAMAVLLSDDPVATSVRRVRLNVSGPDPTTQSLGWAF